MADGINVVGEGLTIEDVREIVNTSSDAEGARLDNLAGEVSKLVDAVNVLNSDESSSADSDEIYTVAISHSQVETAKGAVRLACTEGLVCIALLSAVLGVQLFALFRKGWPNG